MTRTRVKFCGITRVEDAMAAAELGVDALGFVFDAGSKRHITPAVARSLCGSLPPFMRTVALFRNAPAEAVVETLEVLYPDLLQFHGEESPEYCQQFSWPYLKAVPMGETQDLADWALRYGEARGLLVDAHGKGEMGGTGRSFDWARLNQKVDKPIVLAGGLTPDNVAAAIATVHPHAVDVSSGIESQPGVKDRSRMQRFMQEVRRADAA